MNLDSLFVDDAFESPLCYTKTLYGCPGQESLLYGRLSQMTMDQSWMGHDELERSWKLADWFGESDAVDEIWCAKPLATMATVPWIPTSSHGFNISKIESGVVKLRSSEGLMIPQKAEKPKAAASLGGEIMDNKSAERTWVEKNVWGPHDVISFEPDGIGSEGSINELGDAKTECDSQGRLHGILKKLPTSSMKKHKKSQKKPKGLTMCLRTLLRQLLAGTGWIMDTSICKEKAVRLIEILIGPKMQKNIELDFPKDCQANMPEGWRQDYHAQILANIVEHYAGKRIAAVDLEKYIMLSRGPYHLSSRFEMLLGGRQWPPYMPEERCLRAFGCHHRTDASNKKKNRPLAKHNRSTK